MRGHDTDDAAPRSVQTSSNDTEDNVLAGEDTGNLWMTTSTTGTAESARPAVGFHDANGSRSPLFHQSRGILDGRTGSHDGWVIMGIHHCRQIRQGHLVTQGIDVGQHGCCLGVAGHVGTEFILYTGECGRELGSGSGTTLNLCKGFVEDLGDVQETDDVAVFVAYRLHVSEHS